jgi:hypothetical protein
MMAQPPYQTITVTGANRITEGLPDNVKIAIADALIAFAAMEVSAETLIWGFNQLRPDDGKLLTRMDARPKFDLARTFSESRAIHPHPHAATTKDFWAMLTQITDARNKIAHGFWIMLDGTTPVAASYRMKADPGRIMGEAFPIERLNSIAVGCQKIRAVFDEMADRHLASLPIPAQPPLPAAPSSPPDRKRPTRLWHHLRSAWQRLVRLR